MASTKDYLEFILGQLSELSEISSRKMMGEFMIYYKGRYFGGIFDNRFLVKNTSSARGLIPNAPLEKPYEGAKEMLLVEDIDDRAFIRELVESMYSELPEPKKKQ
ncbi:MAG: TfoX/Sxy family protein [Oscillospiraceae bacterium]|nr:TfoX/Sxy family protein [Oscillospiraceae bacterium]